MNNLLLIDNLGKRFVAVSDLVSLYYKNIVVKGKIGFQ